MKPTIRYIIFLVCIIAGTLATTIACAQVTAKFSVTSKSGCSPVYVSFINSSSGTGTLTYNWDFGNGNYSTLISPSQIYDSCGDYVVTLTVSNGTQTSTDTVHITVYCKPTVGFTVSNSSGCPGTCVNFTNTSSAGSGTISSIFWDFGDGNTDISANPTHCYMSPGNYNVTLMITNSYDCSSYKVITNEITINTPPAANFTGTPISQCNPPASVNFSNTSSGTGNLKYNWNFGDPASGALNTSTLDATSHNYISSGEYTVSLIVTDGNGCKDTLTRTNYINISNLTAKISTTPSNSGCCPLIVQFGGNSGGSPTSYLWTFGGGIPNSTTQNPQILFPCPVGNAPAIYNVTLTENFANGCTSTDTATITTTNKTVANFSSNSTLSTCIVPNTVAFINNSTAGAGATYLWNFGDGDTSSAVNPSHSYTACGTHDVTLIATNKYGCSDTLQRTAFVTIICPVAIFTATPIDGCIPKTVGFNSTGSTANPIKWRWNFGDPASGAADSSILQNPTHIYSNPGCYTVTLYTTIASGCTDSVTIKDAVCVDYPANPDFSAAPTTTCAHNAVAFTSLTTGTDLLTTYLWNFGDGATSSSADASHQYTDTGYFNVTLVVCNAGCCDSITFTNYIHILPPVANVSVTMDCKNPYNVCFDGTKSLGASTYDWNFGDPGSGVNNTSTSPTPCHLYSSSGDYTVALTVTNSVTGCSFTKQTTINVRKVKAAFTFLPTSGCVPVTITATNNSVDGNSFRWNVIDSASGSVLYTSDIVNLALTFARVRTVIFELIATDVNGCSDTLFSPTHLHTYGDMANFTATPTAGCGPLNVQFTDGSISPVGPLTSWSWNFGDSFCAAANDTSALQNPTHTYTKPGCYTITLTVTNFWGCSQTYTSTNYVCVTTPATNFTASETDACIGNQICFTTSATNTGNTYSWNFGDPASGVNNTSTLVNPCHVYNANGNYTVSLLETTINGCDSSLTKTNYITISKPVANFGTKGKTISSCLPLIVNFVDSSHSNITSWKWNFGDGNTSTDQNPSHMYSLPGIYTVTLIVTNAGGCSDTLVKTNYVVTTSPNGTFTLGPEKGCYPLEVCFKTDVSTNLSYIWNYGNTTSGPLPGGDTTCYSYTVPGIYYPSLILQDSLGCTFSFNAPDSVVVQGAVAGVSPAGNICAGSSEQLDASGGQFYKWVPSEGLNNPSISDPIASPTVTTTYQVSVSDSDNVCPSDIANVLVTVYPNPPFDAGKDQTVFSGQSVVLGQTSPTFTGNFTWTPDYGLSCDNCQNPVAKPDSTTTYAVTLINQYGCHTSDSVTITILCPGDILFIPNAFTPNGDGVDDVFFIRSVGMKQLNYLRVFDRWGQLVFETNDLSVGWDGTFKGQKLFPGVYVYDLNAICSTGVTIDKKGNVTLIR
jgi:gliding motility-associated-like protein